MFCRNCGNEIPKNAKFCTMCGTQVAAAKTFQSEKSSQQIADGTIGPAEDQTTSDPAALSTGETSEANPAEQQSAATAAGNQMSSSLKAAVESNKKRSRRRMPMILLVALALALATSVAYAAYRVYTDVWVPMQQEQQQKTQAEKDAQEAQSAYDEVIKEHSKALNDIQNQTLNLEEFSEKYPDVNPEHSLLTLPNLKYAETDLNEDGIPELLIGRTILEDEDSYQSENTLISNIVIYDIWSYQNNSLVHVVGRVSRGDYSLRNNGILLDRESGGAYTNQIYAMNLNKQLGDIGRYGDLHMSGDANNWTTIEAISEDFIDGTNNGTAKEPLVKYEKTDAKGNTVESKTCTTEQFRQIVQDLYNKYPEDTSVEWKTISTE